MNTHSTVLDNASVGTTTSNWILQAALAGQGNIREAADEFNYDQLKSWRYGLTAWFSEWIEL
jgi:hypothetical protein